MRSALIIAAVVAQLLMLVIMAGQREWILQKGERVYIRTAPVDPRDPMRGDYVRLSYALNSQSLSAFKGGSTEKLQRGSRVYAVLRKHYDDLYELDYLSQQRPTKMPFITGRVRYVYDDVLQGYVDIDYGIEQLFVQQGKGLDIEKRRGQRDSLQVPMEVELAIGDAGQAQITNYRWSPLGIQLRRLDRDNTGAVTNDGPRSPVLEFSLQNVSDEVLSIVDGDSHCALQLQMLSGRGGFAKPRYQLCGPTELDKEQTITLAPGQSHTVVVDLNQPRWYMQSSRDGDRWGSIAEQQHSGSVYCIDHIMSQNLRPGYRTYGQAVLSAQPLIQEDKLIS